MKKAFFRLLMLAALNACNNDSGKITLTEFQISDANDVSGIRMTKDGKIYMQSEAMGSIDASGEMKDKNGRIIATLADDDYLVDANKQKLVKVDANGTIDNGSGTTIKWNTGKLMKGDEDTGFRIVPADSKSLRAASIILYLYLNALK